MRNTNDKLGTHPPNPLLLEREGGIDAKRSFACKSVSKQERLCENTYFVISAKAGIQKNLEYRLDDPEGTPSLHWNDSIQTDSGF